MAGPVIDDDASVLRRRIAALELGHVVELARLDGSAVRDYGGSARGFGSAAREIGGTAALDLGRQWREAALVSVYHMGQPVAFGWLRYQPNGSVDVIASSGTAGAAVFLPGGRGLPVPWAMPDLLRRFDFWVRIGAVYGDPAPQTAGARPLPVEDQLLGLWRARFGWMVLAEPLPLGRIDADAGEAAEQQRSAWSRRDSPRQAAEARRWQHRYDELCRGRSTGFWRIHLLAGADSAAGAANVAALLCTSMQFHGLPYTLMRTGPADSIDALLDREVVAGDGLKSPILAGTPLLAAITVPPSTEIPGVRLVARPAFDVTPELSTDDGRGLTLGTILDGYGNPAGNLDLAAESLRRHTIVVGATGSGKSQTIRGLLEQATRAGIPWLVVEPAKAEYRLMANRLPGTDIIVVRPGDPDAPPGGINPLEPAWLDTGNGTIRFPLQTHADLVRALFLASFAADEPFPQVLSAALTSCYEDYGWDLALSESRHPAMGARYPTLGDLTWAAERVVGRIGYSEEITRNVTGYIRVRTESLRHGTTGHFLEGGHRLDFANLLRHNVIFEIEDVGDDRDKAFLIGTVLIRLAEHLRLSQQVHTGPQRLRHLAVFEEAHRLLRQTAQQGPAAHAVEMFASLLAEVRAYGQGIVLAEQIPTKIVSDSVKNTAVKVVHRLPARDDRDTIGAAMNLTEEQSKYLVTLAPGLAAVFSDGMDNPMLVRMPDRLAVENSGPPNTVSVARLIRPRSNTCAVDCRDAPCTLRDIRYAQRLLTAQPWMTVWAELSVLAHLTGWPTPTPVTAVLAHRVAQREWDCALSQAVDHAIASRGAIVHDHGGLAGHLADVMRGQHTEPDQHLARRGCRPEEPEFLAAPYRWTLVWDSLHDTVLRDPDHGRHGATARWEHEYGIQIPGDTAREQLTVVGRWQDNAQRDQRLLTTVAYGDRTPSALEQAIGTPMTSEAIAEALARFGECDWPLRYLSPH